jgi:hypothetical protein
MVVEVDAGRSGRSHAVARADQATAKQGGLRSVLAILQRHCGEADRRGLDAGRHLVEIARESQQAGTHPLCQPPITGCERYVARNQQEQTVKRVLRIIGDSGQKGLSQDELSHKLQWLPRKTRLELIADLVESGQVQAARIETGGRPKCKYRLSTHPSKGNPH